MAQKISERSAMTWDYGEVNPLGGSSGSLELSTKQLCRLLRKPFFERSNLEPANVNHASALDIPYPDNHIDAVLTDPPYYNSVPYADLSDFFYVWMKRAVGNVFADIFATPLTPKSEEICEMAG
jgi:adenine-specific DNA methylase